MSTTTDINAPATWLEDIIKQVFGDGPFATVVDVVILIAVTALIAHICTRFLRHALSHEDSLLPESTIFVNICRVAVWGIGISVILSTVFNIDVNALIAAIGIGGIALSLGLQDTVKNLIGGLQLSVMGVVKPGDHIEMSGNRGVVHDVNWRHTTLETTTGGMIVIPNSVINTAAFTHLPDIEKVTVSISVTKQVNDLDELAKHMEDLVTEAVSEVATVEKPVKVLFDSTTEFGYSGTIVIWVSEDDDNVLLVKDAAVRAIAPLTKGYDY